MNPSALALLRCPCCRARPHTAKHDASTGAAVEQLTCAGCGKIYPIEDGIPRFVSIDEIQKSYPEIAEQTAAGARFYDFVCVQQFLEIIGIEVEEARHEYLDRLEARPGARVLDVGAGTGSEMVFLAGQTSGLELHGIDLSVEMLRHCQKKLRKAELTAELYIGLVERLPFADDSFDVVFHMGAFNEFQDKHGAIAEMIRVARPGTRVLIADEWLTSENTNSAIGRKLRDTFPSMSLDSQPPVDLIPRDMLERALTPIFKGFGYCVDFRKPVRG